MGQEELEKLKSVGINVDEALGRMMGKEALMLRLMKMFPTDPNYELLVEAAKKGDVDEALKASHTLKGVSGNLSIISLHELTAKQVELFRANEPEKAFAMMDDITATYEKVVNVLNSL